MARVLIIGIIAAVMFWVVSVVDCAVQPAFRHRGVSKPAWIAIVILLPVIGGILWFWLGRLRKSSVRRGAPDDDAAFLSSLGGSSSGSGSIFSAAEQDERIRALEEQLAELDAEDGTAEEPKPDDDDSRDQHGARG